MHSEFNELENGVFNTCLGVRPTPARPLLHMRGRIENSAAILFVCESRVTSNEEHSPIRILIADANAMICELLSEAFRRRRVDVQLQRGARGRSRGRSQRQEHAGKPCLLHDASSRIGWCLAQSAEPIS